MVFTLLELLVAIHQSLLLVFLLLFPGQYFIRGSGWPGNCQPRDYNFFLPSQTPSYLSPALQVSTQGRFLVSSDQPTGLPVLSVSGNYHRVQLAVLWASYTPLSP